MKFILSLLLLTLTLFGRADLDEYAQKMGFERNYYTALSKAKKENKLLMVIITKPECPWCDRLEDKTLANEKVHKRLLKELVTVLLYKDFDADDYPQKKFPAPFTPRTFFVNPKTQEVLFVLNGYIKTEEFLQQLEILTELWDK